MHSGFVHVADWSEARDKWLGPGTQDQSVGISLWSKHWITATIVFVSFLPILTIFFATHGGRQMQGLSFIYTQEAKNFLRKTKRI